MPDPGVTRILIVTASRECTDQSPVPLTADDAAGWLLASGDTFHARPGGAWAISSAITMVTTYGARSAFVNGPDGRELRVTGPGGTVMHFKAVR